MINLVSTLILQPLRYNFEISSCGFLENKTVSSVTGKLTEEIIIREGRGDRKEIDLRETDETLQRVCEGEE